MNCRAYDGETVEESALTLGVEHVEGERRFPRPARSGDDDELVVGELDVNALEVVLTSAEDPDRAFARDPRCVGSDARERAVDVPAPWAGADLCPDICPDICAGLRADHARRPRLDDLGAVSREAEVHRERAARRASSAAMSSGVPSPTTLPPSSPPSGPRSTIQSDSAATSRSCSTMITRAPFVDEPADRRDDEGDDPLTGQARRRLVEDVEEALLVFGLCKVGCELEGRWASPPESVGAGCESERYPSPTSRSGWIAFTIFFLSANIRRPPLPWSSRSEAMS